MIDIVAQVTCDNCGVGIRWSQNKNTEPQKRDNYGISKISGYARRHEWQIGKTRDLCPECKKAAKK
jgi:hypothetical protein